MDKVKAGLRGLTPLEKATRAAIVYFKMNGNPDFPNPEPSMAVFHAAYIDLKEANLAALDRGRMAIAHRERAVQRMDQYLSRLAGYVNSACLGDTLKLANSGFKLVKRAEPISSLKAPRNLRVRATAFPGQVKLRWNRVQGALIYEVERATNDGNGVERWERVALTSKPQLLVDGLQSNAFYNYRVCAVGTKTQSPYCPTAFGKAA